MRPSRRGRRRSGHIADDEAQDAAVDQEEGERRQPQAGDVRAPAQELESEALLQPRRLGGHPQRRGGEAQRSAPQEAGAGQIQRQEDHVPQEVLRLRSSSAQCFLRAGVL